MLTKVKEKFRKIFEPTADLIHSIGLSPNIVTVLGFTFSLTSAFLYYIGSLFLAASLLLLSGYFDAIDGLLAEKYYKKTRLGAFLDSTLDRISDALVLFAIITAGYCELAWGITALISILLISYVRAKAKGLGIEVGGVGIMERTERILFLVAITFLSYIWQQAIAVGIIALTLLSSLTILQRVVYVWKKLTGF